MMIYVSDQSERITVTKKTDQSEESLKRPK